jgi:hypothetical protein
MQTNIDAAANVTGVVLGDSRLKWPLGGAKGVESGPSF